MKNFWLGVICGIVFFAISPFWTLPIKASIWCGDSNFLACEIIDFDAFDGYIGLFAGKREWKW